MTELKNKLQEPFKENEVEWRIGSTGFKKDGTPWAMCLAYINARAVMDRLDNVVGPERWKDTYKEVGGGAMCELSIKIGDEWVTKMNGSDPTDTEAFKGTISKAFVRTAVNWGIGRYLYDLKGCYAVIVNDRAAPSAKIKDKYSNKEEYVNWVPPKLPEWAMPSSGQAVKDLLNKPYVGDLNKLDIPAAIDNRTKPAPVKTFSGVTLEKWQSRLYAIAKECGLTNGEMEGILLQSGFKSFKDIVWDKSKDIENAFRDFNKDNFK